jgi:hypothetical protein
MPILKASTWATNVASAINAWVTKVVLPHRSVALINLEFIINTLSLGSLYAMLALGLVIVYGIL